jgi:hypothetical protein
MEAVSLRIINQYYSQAPQHIQSSKKESLSSLYQYLIYKVFEEPAEPQKGLKAGKLLWGFIKNDTSKHRQFRLKFSLLSKVVATILLPKYQPDSNW